MHRPSWREFAYVPLVLVIAAGCSGEAEDPQESFETAYVVSQLLFAPGSRFQLVHIVPDLEPQELALDEAFEFSGFSRVRAFDGKVFVFEGERGQVIRYRVTPALSLEEEERLSFANLGITSFGPSITFASSTRAYFVSSATREIVVFDPDAMQIVAAIPFLQLGREGFALTFTSAPTVIGDEVYVSIAWADTATLRYVPEVTVAVFSASELRLLRVLSDDRCGFGFRGFAHEGAFYTMGDGVNGLANLGLDGISPPCLLRIPAGSDRFDPDFYVDLAAASGREIVAGGPFGIGDGRFLTMVYDDDVEPSAIDLAEFAQLSIWRWAIMELPTAETQVLEELPLGGVNTLLRPTVVDGTTYVSVTTELPTSSQLFRIEDDSRVTPIIRSETGYNLQVDRVF
ncbi:MAG: DUF4374 domain-containing protein [Myxococcota bacterium]